jgi:SAM-dependent methyltransferase
MYGTPEARKTLDPKYMTGYLKQSQWIEHIELKTIITELYEKKGLPIDVFDIGVGEARVPINLAEIDEIWNCIWSYHGIDIDHNILKAAEKNVREHNLSNKVELSFFDARRLSERLEFDIRYDLILCTYFTAGNFPPDSYKFNAKNQHVDESEIKNAFQRVFKPAYDLLQSSGKLVLGSTYVDNESTEERQIGFYESCGMEVISKKGPFIATDKKFWSLRFSPERIMDYFDFVKPDNIEIRPLDNYKFAQMVVVKK